MAVYVFEAIITCSTKALRDGLMDYIEKGTRPYINKIDIKGNFQLRFRGRVNSIGVINSVRGWLTGRMNSETDSDFMMQLWYDKMIKKTKTIMVPNPNPPPNEIEEEMQYEEPASVGEEIILGKLGVTEIA